MRLIDADELLKKHTCDVYGAYDDSCMVQAVFVPYIKGAPTIEAAPVVHGRWIEDDARGRHCCSVCEFEVHDDASHVMFGDWRIAPKYCPNCGARMDGDGDA